jgi:pimeloyl-ACP methyl ester carboxylesterase
MLASQYPARERCHDARRCPVFAGARPIERPARDRNPFRKVPSMPPTIVLVHGAFAESASWDRVID